MNDRVKDIFDSRAFIVGKITGVTITSPKDISLKKGCQFNFADVIAQLIHDKFTHEGIQAEPIMPVSSIYYILDEWKQTGKIPKPGNNRYFYSISLYKDGDIYKVFYQIAIIDGNTVKDQVENRLALAFHPDSYSDPETCYADFSKVIQPIIDEAYQVMMNKISKSDL